ncbi:MAG: ABC transporter permease [Nitrosomonas sp.]|nr:MAG: ABC transporter permease [Nitrosomonas sp.]
MFIDVAWRSLCHRKCTAVLALVSVAISVFVLLGVEHIRHQAKQSFSKTVSGVDLIVGARTGQTNLLLYTVFHIGHPTNNISWQSYRKLAGDTKVAWAIPVSLGDSHRGYRVVGTTEDFFTRFRAGDNAGLGFAEGKAFAEIFEVVLGADVAKKLNYGLRDRIVLAHGLGQTSFSMHDDRPFRVSGILRPTGTPVDQAVYVSLQGMEAIHLNWREGTGLSGKRAVAQDIESPDLTPRNITAVMLGLQSKLTAFQVQRQVNHDAGEPLLAIMPGVALAELWQMMRNMEHTFQVISALVLFSSLLGLSTMLLSSIRERRQEIAVMRAIGASPRFVFLLIQLEAFAITVVGIIVAVVALSIAAMFSQSYLAAHFGIFIGDYVITGQTWRLLGLIVSATAVFSLIPALSAYRLSLHTSLRPG